MRDQEVDIYLWHDCLDCSCLNNGNCPLEGTTEYERIVARLKQSDDFCCTRFLRH